MEFNAGATITFGVSLNALRNELNSTPIWSPRGAGEERNQRNGRNTVADDEERDTGLNAEPNFDANSELNAGLPDWG